MSPSLLPHSGLYWPITSLHSPNPLFQRLLTSSALASLTNLASFLLPNPIFWHLLVITFYDSTLYTFCLSSSCYFTLSSHFFLFALTLPLLPSNHLNIFFFCEYGFLKKLFTSPPSLLIPAMCLLLSPCLFASFYLCTEKPPWCFTTWLTKALLCLHVHFL